MGDTAAARTAFLGLLLTACGSPTAPAPAPKERTPRPPAANDCPAVGSPFGNAFFHAQDLATDRSCQVYLEQDECVVAIWDDCTVLAATTHRSWEGRIDPTPGTVTTIWLRSTSRGSGQPSAQCQGELELDAVTPRVLLSCQPDQGTPYRMYLERVIDEEPLGESLGSLSTGGGMLEEVVAFTAAGGARMVAAVSSMAFDQGGGLVLFRERASGDFERVDARVDFGFLLTAAATADGGKLLLGGSTDLLVLDTNSLALSGRESLNAGNDDGVRGIAITGPNEAVVGIRRGSLGQVEVQRYQIDPLLRVGAPKLIADTQLDRLFPEFSPGGPIYLFVHQSNLGARLLSLDPTSLEERPEVYDMPGDEGLEVFMTRARDSVLFMDHHGFGERQLGNAQFYGYYPVPYLLRGSAVGHEPTRDWLLAGGSRVGDRLGAVYPVERATGRPLPRSLVTNDTPLSMAVQGDLLFVGAGAKIHVVRLPSD